MINYTAPKIIVAEDDALSQQVIATLLNFIQLDADFVWDGKQLIEKLNERHYDILFLDLNMPEVDGLTAAKLIRNGETIFDHSDMHIVALTSELLYYAVPACRECGINNFIQKPLTISKLRAALNSSGLFSINTRGAPENELQTDDLIVLNQSYIKAI